MSDTIEYYFTTGSPFAYLGHRKLVSIASEHGKTIAFKPFNIAGVWAESGSVPPAQRSAIRQRYRLIEIARVGIFRDVCVLANPTNFPTDPTLADHCICALTDSGSDPAAFSEAVGRALWEQDKQIADETVIRSLLIECGHDGDHILKLAGEPAAAESRKANTQSAINHDATGSPAYVYRGEVFWGQDRLEYLEQMIASGREPLVSAR